MKRPPLVSENSPFLVTMTRVLPWLSVRRSSAMFSSPVTDYQIDPVLVRAMNKLLILHADHDQNCSTSTVRLVGSAGQRPGQQSAHQGRPAVGIESLGHPPIPAPGRCGGKRFGRGRL